MNALLPVAHDLRFAVVVTTNNGSNEFAHVDLTGAVREALIKALPPGTGVGAVHCEIRMSDWKLQK